MLQSRLCMYMFIWQHNYVQIMFKRKGNKRDCRSNHISFGIVYIQDGLKIASAIAI